ncbi:hypothetical protein ACFC58_06415 [Kitasatospora purpeofusca]|uniref:hypothetical protein n=1 Tax=Kitasatospora purpeofusca TaxID=67352 RepID=UPI0035DC842C
MDSTDDGTRATSASGVAHPPRLDPATAPAISTAPEADPRTYPAPVTSYRPPPTTAGAHLLPEAPATRETGTDSSAPGGAAPRRRPRTVNLPPPNPGARWLDSTVPLPPGQLLTCWRTSPGTPVPVPAATATWHAIRVHHRLGAIALRHLTGPPGPVLQEQFGTVFFVPPLTTPWPVLLTGITNDTQGQRWNWGEELTAHLAAPHQRLALPEPGTPPAPTTRWIVPPDGSGQLTLAGQLATALHLALPAAGEIRPTQPTAPRTVAAFFRRTRPQHHQEAS